MKYLGDSFSVFPGGSKSYRDNYDKIFGKKDKEDKKLDDLNNQEPIPIPPAPPELDKPKKKKAKNEKAKKTK
jgi:hypothetical protein